jgi:ATP-dependent DNA helicase RecG
LVFVQPLTVAGLLMFGAEPQRFTPQSRLSAVAILDRREITGRLPTIIEDTRLLWCETSASQRWNWDSGARTFFCMTARRWARWWLTPSPTGYSLSGSQIRLFVFPDRVEACSPGRLPNSVTLDNIRLGIHAERNRRLATLLTQLGYMSAIGAGIPRLIIRLSRLLSGR